MNPIVIDASIAVKWVIEEDGTPEAVALRRSLKPMAPDLLIAECANILWKKVRRGELSRQQAALAARLLQGADIELLPTRSLMQKTVEIALDLDHPAYDCLYLALALDRGVQFVTADKQLLRKLDRASLTYRDVAVSLKDIAASSAPPP